MNIYNEGEYEINSTHEMYDVLAELPFDLIKENIEDQIKHPAEISIDYVDLVEDKYNVAASVYEADDDLLRTLKSQYLDFFYDISVKINKAYDLCLDVDGIMMNGDIEEVGEVLYNFFVLRYTKNVAGYITNYINTHKKSLYDLFNDVTKKDVSTLVYKKFIKSKEDLVIVTCLPDIIKYIIKLDIEPIEFVELCAGEDSYEGEVLIDLIASSHLVGDFVHRYLTLQSSDDERILDDVYTEIKSRLIGESGFISGGLL